MENLQAFNRKKKIIALEKQVLTLQEVTAKDMASKCT